MKDAPTLPGDVSASRKIARMIRVDHAGEYGAQRIYQGQLAILGRGPAGPSLRHMLAQEDAHRASFDGLIATRRVRPTALLPLWHVAGFALGAATALLGERTAMACTIAVEEAIDEHYQAQTLALGPEEAALGETIEGFRREELEHRDIAIEREGEQAPAYRALAAMIKTGCRIAIAVSERV